MLSVDQQQQQSSLLEFLDISQLNCLNEAEHHSLKGILQHKSKNTSAQNYLLSDADAQLLLNIHFNQAVRIRSLAITSSAPSQAPKSIKLVVNKPSLGFEDVEDAQESQIAQAIQLSEEQVRNGQTIDLRFVRFQSVNSLHIFVESNHGEEDETRIDAIEIFGIPIEATKDLSGLKKTE